MGGVAIHGGLGTARRLQRSGGGLPDNGHRGVVVYGGAATFLPEAPGRNAPPLERRY